MTKLKRVVKRTGAGVIREAGKNREIVIILRPPNVLGFRAKGCRKEYQLTSEACYTMAVRADIIHQKKEKAKRRKERQKRIRQGR